MAADMPVAEAAVSTEAAVAASTEEEAPSADTMEAAIAVDLTVVVGTPAAEPIAAGTAAVPTAAAARTAARVAHLPADAVPMSVVAGLGKAALPGMRRQDGINSVPATARTALAPPPETRQVAQTQRQEDPTP